MSIHSIIFDFGGVLGSDANNWTNNDQVTKTIGLSKQEIDTIFIKHWDKLKVGQEDLEDYYQDILIQSKDANKLISSTLRQMYNDEIFIHQDIFVLAKNLSRNYSLYILANESLEGLKYKREKFQLQDVFKSIFNSAELGLYKPQHEVFKNVLTQIKENPSNVLFIDDQEKNVIAARELDIKGIHFRNVEQLTEELKNLGITFDL